MATVNMLKINITLQFAYEMQFDKGVFLVKCVKMALNGIKVDEKMMLGVELRCRE